MGNCDKWLDYISLNADDKLNSDELLELLEHLDECSDCQKLYKETKAIKENLNSIELKYPENLTELILANIEFETEEEVVQPILPKRKQQYMALVACASVAVFVSCFNLFESLQVSYEHNYDTPVEQRNISENNEMMSENAEVMSILSHEEHINFPLDKSNEADLNEYSSNNIQAFSENEIKKEGNFDDRNMAYAFVYAFEGNVELPLDIEGEVIKIDSNTTHIIVSNNMPIVERVISLLEQNNYIKTNKENSPYNISSEALVGLIVIEQK